SSCWARTRSRTGSGREDSALSSTVRETESCAASTAVSTAATTPEARIRGIRASSARVSTGPPRGWVSQVSWGGRSAGGAGGEEGEQQGALELEHLGALVLLHVVVAQQVEDRVDCQQQHLLDGAVPGLGGLLGGDRGAQHHVAQQALRCGLLRGAGDQLVHR